MSLVAQSLKKLFKRPWSPPVAVVAVMSSGDCGGGGSDE